MSEGVDGESDDNGEMLKTLCSLKKDEFLYTIRD